MVDFSLSRIEQSLVEEFRFFARDLLRPHAAEADRMGDVPPALLRCPEVLNFMRSSIPQKFGGGWRSLADARNDYDLFGSAILRVLASEEGGYGDAALFAALPGAGLAAPVVHAFASADVKKNFFSCFAQDRSPQWAAFALSEPQTGSDMAAISTTAQKRDHGYVLNGKKTFVGNGARAAWTVAMATTNPRLGQFGIRPFLVQRGVPGFTIKRRLCSVGFRALGICELEFQECSLPEECLLKPKQPLPRHNGFEAGQAVFQHFRPMVAAMAIGAAKAAIEQVEELARQNGAAQSLARESQHIRGRIQTMKVKLHAARLLCWKAAWLTDQGAATAMEISMAKLQGTRVARGICGECMDIAGQAAAGDTLILAKLFRDMKALEVMEGTGEIHRLIITRGLPSLTQAATLSQEAR